MPDQKSEPSVHRCIIRNLPVENGVVGEIIVEGENAAQCCDKILRLLKRKSRAKKSDASVSPTQSTVDLLDDVIERYISDLIRRNLGLTYIQLNRQTLGIMLAAIGNKPLASITGDDIRRTLDSFKFWPNNARRKPSMKDLSFAEILDIGRRSTPRPINAETYNNHIRRINAFFNTQQDADKSFRSPASGIAKEIDTSTAAKNRRPFTTGELEKIFDPEAYSEWTKDKPHRWWGPLLALYTGARISEIAQLRTTDIHTVDGVTCICIQVTAKGQHLKNPSSIRAIPIAKPLLDANFLAYVNEVRATGQDRLFPHLPLTITVKDGEAYIKGYGGTLVQQFGRYIKKHGFKKGIGSHVFRHTFATNLTKEKVGAVQIAALTGHTVVGAPSESVSVPGLLSYIDRGLCPPELRACAETLSKFYPGIEIPVYIPGQFAKALSNKSEFHQ